MDSKYNGWRNYETWLANLWLNNDQGTYWFWCEEARDAWRYAATTDYLTRQQSARRELAKRLQNEIEENSPCPEAGLYSDLLNSAISEIDWYEVADAFLEDIADEDDIEPGED